MSIRRLADGTPVQAGTTAMPGLTTNSHTAEVMPVGPDVDVNSLLGPLIDGSFSQAQGQAAIMAGVRTPTPNESTAPVKSTAPLPGTAPLPPTGGVGARDAGQAQANMRVPPQLVQGLVQRILAGL